MTDIEYEYKNERLIDADLKCSICQTPFNDPYSTRCKHLYCRECITNWLREHNTCPLCKQSPVRVTDLVKAEVIVTNELNRLLVTCTKCGKSNIRRDKIGDHVTNHCAGIRLYSSEITRDGSVDERSDGDLDFSIMGPSGSAINQLREDLQCQKALINTHKDQTNNNMKTIFEQLKKQQDEIQTIKQSNNKHQTKIEQLEDIIQTQKEQIKEQNNSINQLQIDNQCLQNQIKGQAKDSSEHEDQIYNLWEKINPLVPHENSRLETYITEECSFGSELVLSDQKLTDRHMKIVVKRAIINRQCSSLNLTKNRITSQGALIIANAFHLNVRLEKLHLSHNCFSDKGVQFLAEALLANTTLTELTLGSNEITNEGIVHLSEMLQVNETLKKLDLNGNEIDDDGMKLLADVLSEHNQTLQTLSLHSNILITDKSVNSIIDMFRQTRSLKRFEIHECDFSNGFRTRLRDAAENESISICV